MEKPTKPFSIEYIEEKRKIVNAVNEATQKIPFYLLTEIIDSISKQVNECAKSEIERAQAEYAQKLAEYEAKEKAE